MLSTNRPRCLLVFYSFVGSTALCVATCQTKMLEYIRYLSLSSCREQHKRRPTRRRTKRHEEKARGEGRDTREDTRRDKSLHIRMGSQPSRPDEMKAKQLKSWSRQMFWYYAPVQVFTNRSSCPTPLRHRFALQSSIRFLRRFRSCHLQRYCEGILLLGRTYSPCNCKHTDIQCSVLPLCHGFHGRWMRTRTEILRTMTFAFRNGYKRRLTCFMDFGGCASTIIAAQVRYLPVLLAVLLLSSVVLLLSFLNLSTLT